MDREIYDDNIVLDEQDIEMLKECGYIYVDTPCGLYCVETGDHFEIGKEPEPMPQEDDYLTYK